jgi:hypothetical protein
MEFSRIMGLESRGLYPPYPTLLALRRDLPTSKQKQLSLLPPIPASSCIEKTTLYVRLLVFKEIYENWLTEKAQNFFEDKVKNYSKKVGVRGNGGCNYKES